MHFPDSPATVHHLENGLTVLVDATVDAPVVSCQFWVGTGSMHEAPRLGSGVSHLLEHMVFKGTQKYSSQSLGDTVQAAGGQWNAYTTFDRTVYYIDGPSENVHTFLDVLSEMMFRPAFPKDEFERERDVIRREIDMGKDNPSSVGSRLLFSTAYQKDPRKHPVIGHLDLFNALTYEDMTSYHNSRYTPRNIFVVVAGSVDTDAVIKSLTSLTPEISQRYDDQPVIPTEPRQMAPRTARTRFAVPVSHLTLSWQAPDQSHSDAAALDLLATVLGAGRSSSLYRELREERNLCLGIYASSWLPPHGPGLFTVGAEVELKDRELLQKEILQHIEKAVTQLTSKDLKKALSMTLMSQFRTLSTASGRASDLASNWHEARNIDYTKHYLDQLSRVTVENVQSAARKWIVPTTLTVTSVDPMKEGMDIAPDILTRKSTQQNVETRTLPNGLTLVLGADNKLPLVHLSTVSLGGLLSETAQTHGINSLLSSVLDKGTQTVSAEDFALQLDEAGARFSVGSGNNTFSAQGEFLSEDSASILGLIGGALTAPALPEAAIEREKAPLTAAIEEARTKPLQEAFRLSREQLFGQSTYGLGRIGSIKPLQSLTQEQLESHRSQLFAADNTVIAAFGNFDLDQLSDEVTKAFQDMPKGKRFQPPTTLQTVGQKRTLTLDKNQAALVISFPTHGITSEHTTAWELINSHTSDMSGPLFGRIREELGLAYSVGSTIWHGLDAGMFSFYLATAPDQVDLAQAELLKEIDKLLENGLTSDDFNAAQTSQLASGALGNQANAARAQLAALDVLLGFPADRFRRQTELIKQLTIDEVREQAQALFSQAPTISIVTP